MTKRGLFLALFGCLLAVVLAESLATPRNAGPDEPAHIVRGAGLVRGEVFGTQLAEWSAEHGGDVPEAGGADIANADQDSDALRVFDVPRSVVQPSEACFAHNPVSPGELCHRRRDGRLGGVVDSGQLSDLGACAARPGNRDRRRTGGSLARPLPPCPPPGGVDRGHAPPSRRR